MSHAMPWDLVVIDEAHRLRNVYKPSNVIANTLKQALAGKRQAAAHRHAAAELAAGAVRPGQLHRRARLRRPEELSRAVRQSRPGRRSSRRSRPGSSPSATAPCAARSLPTFQYTQRLPLVQEFTPEESEDRLYDLVSDYLRATTSSPAGQPALPDDAGAAQAAGLVHLRHRRRAGVDVEPAQGQAAQKRTGRIARRGTGPRTTRPSTRPLRNGRRTSRAEPLSDADRAAIEQEIADLDAFAQLAASIEHNAKGKALLKALEHRLRQGRRHSARPQKAIIFTESRRTQELPAARAGRQPVCRRHRAVQRLQHRRPLQADLRRLAGAPSRAPTASPARAPPTCARPWWTTSASRAAS